MMEFDSTLLSVLHEFSELDGFILEKEQEFLQDFQPFPSLDVQGGGLTSGSGSKLETQPVAGPGPGSLQAQAALALQSHPRGGVVKGQKRIRGFAATTSCTPKDVAALQHLYDEKIAALEKLQQENALLRKRSRMLQLIVNCRDEQVKRLQLLKSGQFADPFIAFGISVEDIAKGDQPSFLQRFKVIVNELGTCLMEDPSMNNRRLVHTMRAMLECHKHVYLVKPDVLALTNKHVNSEGPDEEWHAPEGWWQQVVAQVIFRPEQLEDTSQLYDMYCTWHDKLMSERQQLVTALSALSAEPRYGKGIHDAATSTTGCSSHAAEGKLVQELQRNLIKERCLIVLVDEVWLLHVLDLVQYAQIMFHSYPHVTDVIAVLAAAAALKRGSPVPGAIANGGAQ